MKRSAWLVLVCACTAPPAAHEDVSASRADVTASLYKQLDMVLARQAELARQSDGEAAVERAELLRLAAEIAIRIARVDPQVDGRSLVERIEHAR